MDHETGTTAIIPHYRDSERIPRQLGSLFAQTRPFAQITVVDDGSPEEDFARLAEALARFPAVNLVRIPVNEGPAAACNIGLEAVATEFVAFVAADDSLQPEFLETSEQLLSRSPGVGFCFADPQFSREGGQTTSFPLRLAPEASCFSPQDVRNLLERVQFTFTNNTTLFRTRAVREARGFIPSLGSFTDVFATLVIAFRQGCCYTPLTLGTFDLRSDSYSGELNSRRGEMDRILREMLRLLRSEFRDVYDDFRRCAVAPRHDLVALARLLGTCEGRAYLTPKLAWRCTYLGVWHALRPHLSDNLRRAARRGAMRLATLRAEPRR